MGEADGNISALLEAVQGGSEQAAADLLPMVYDEMRRLAAARMAKLRPGQTLQPTALVHEAYMELVDKGDRKWEGRRHFFGAAARAMREILVDHARRRGAVKRGGDRQRVDQTMGALADHKGLDDEDVLALDEALDELAREHARQADIVVMRFFGGLTHDEIAAELNVTVRTVERDWRFARAWLKRRLGADESAGGR